MRFNGATAFLPWNRVRPPRSTPCPPRRFNGATAFLPWNPRDLLHRATSGRGFNGATAFLPWNLTTEYLIESRFELLQWGHGISAVESWLAEGWCDLEGQASMGPRHFCRGITENGVFPMSALLRFNGATAFLPWNQRTKPNSQRIGTCFNGATAFLPWNPFAAARGSCPAFWLQWGHGISAVESNKKLLDYNAKVAASMGPRHFCRGISTHGTARSCSYCGSLCEPLYLHTTLPRR